MGIVLIAIIIAAVALTALTCHIAEGYGRTDAADYYRGYYRSMERLTNRRKDREDGYNVQP